ncbi:MAG: Ohr family peroxiredoxin [Prosthecobacter sp.]
MKTLFTAEAVSKGGRSGTLKSPEGILDVTLGNPLERGVESHGLNPELMFAGAYAACYNGALVNAAQTLSTEVKDTTTRALVSLVEDDLGGYNISVELHAELPGIERDLAQRIMEKAHETCPYSKVMCGDASVTLVLD